MKLATLPNGKPNGKLVIVSRDLAKAIDATPIANTMQEALDDWDNIAPQLQKISDALNEGKSDVAYAFDQTIAMAPLPRAYQWIDCSSFLCHGRLLDKAFGIDPIMDADTLPIMYQGASDAFIAPYQDAQFIDEAHGIDFEAELGMIIGACKAGITREEAKDKVRLLVLINDWSMRALQPYEMKRGFGLIHSKGVTGFGPVACTPDEFGDDWRDEKLHITVNVWRNDEKFGSVNSSAMDFGFTRLIESAARTRPLGEGTVMGFGTVSEGNPHQVGSCCITEKRGQEIIDKGTPSLPFMHFGEEVSIESFDANGISYFGKIHQKVTKA